MIFTSLLIARWLTGAWYPDLVLIVLTSTVAGTLSATAFGVYLLLSLNLLKRHSNEAFSALRIEDYKCFLRLRIWKDGVLTIFPIGLKKVSKDDDAEGPRDPELLPHLIEPPSAFNAFHLAEPGRWHRGPRLLSRILPELVSASSVAD